MTDHPKTWHCYHVDGPPTVAQRVKPRKVAHCCWCGKDVTVDYLEKEKVGHGSYWRLWEAPAITDVEACPKRPVAAKYQRKP